MISTFFSDWLALGQSQAPAAQSQLARALKSSLEFGAQWQSLQADTMTALLRQQVGAFKAQREMLGVATLLDLQQSVKHDLATQQQAMAEAMAERTERCLNDLANVSSKEDLAIVAAGYMKDLGAALEHSGQEGGTVLNAASAAVTVLMQQALERAIDGAPAA